MMTRTDAKVLIMNETRKEMRQKVTHAGNQ